MLYYASWWNVTWQWIDLRRTRYFLRCNASLNFFFSLFVGESPTVRDNVSHFIRLHLRWHIVAHIYIIFIIIIIIIIIIIVIIIIITIIIIIISIIFIILLVLHSYAEMNFIMRNFESTLDNHCTRGRLISTPVWPALLSLSTVRDRVSETSNLVNDSSKSDHLLKLINIIFFFSSAFFFFFFFLWNNVKNNARVAIVRVINRHVYNFFFLLSPSGFKRCGKKEGKYRN